MAGGYITARAAEKVEVNKVIQSDLDRMRISRSMDDMQKDLSAIKNGSDRVTQLLLVTKQAYNDLELLGKCCEFLFDQHIEDQGINAVHLPMMTELYLMPFRSPLPISPGRAYMDDFCLQSRLLDIISCVLDVEAQKNALPVEMPSQNSLRSLFRFALEKGSSSPDLVKQVKTCLTQLEASEKSPPPAKRDAQPPLPPKDLRNTHPSDKGIVPSVSPITPEASQPPH